MSLKTCALTVTEKSHLNHAEDRRNQAVLVLQPIPGTGQEPPVLLDRDVTELPNCVVTDRGAAEIVVRRNQLGWNLQTHAGECRLNGSPVTEGWLSAGDRVAISGREYLVRTATVEELLGSLPQTAANSLVEGDERLSDQAIAVAARERDLAEWEECLSACEADLEMRTMRVGHERAPFSVTSVDDVDHTLLAEIQELRTNPRAFETDRRRMQDWLETLQRERSVLEQERARLDSARALLETDPSTGEAGPVSENHNGPIGMEWHEPQAQPAEVRRRSTVLLKGALVAMSFALASVLYLNHGAMETPISALMWGSAAIGLITLSGLVHTWTEIHRLDARLSRTTHLDGYRESTDSPTLFSSL